MPRNVVLLCNTNATQTAASCRPLRMSLPHYALVDIHSEMLIATASCVRWANVRPNCATCATLQIVLCTKIESRAPEGICASELCTQTADCKIKASLQNICKLVNTSMTQMLLLLLTICLLYYATNVLQAADGQSISNTVHRTQAATERINDLSCYECDTMDHGELCVNVVTHNQSSFIRKCKGEEFICMVKRFSYTTSTENTTSLPKMWSLDRRCAVSCEAGCIVIGERTKLYACTSCCEKSLCNTGRGSAMSIFERVKTGIGTAALSVAIGVALQPLLSDSRNV